MTPDLTSIDNWLVAATKVPDVVPWIHKDITLHGTTVQYHHHHNQPSLRLNNSMQDAHQTTTGIHKRVMLYLGSTP